MKDASLLRRLVASDRTGALRVAVIEGLASVDLPSAAVAASKLLPQLTEADNPSRLIKAFLTQEGGDIALAKSLTSVDTTLPADVTKLCLRVVRTSGRELQSLVDAIQRISASSGQDEKLSSAEQKLLLADALSQGDARLGESVYRRQELNCQKCHAIGGAGGEVGPDLASIGASAPADYILESLIDPSAKIKENYHSLVVSTDEGRVFTGVKLRETNDSLMLRDAEDNEISIPLDSIEEQKDGGSLMPADLLKELTRKETLDLVRFLSELGKIGDFALPREAYVRSWETLSANINKDLLNRRSDPEVAVDERFQWQPVYSRVAGDLPQAELPAHLSLNSERIKRYLRFPIEMTNAGNRTLTFDHLEGINLLIDGKPTEVKSSTTLWLTLGRHTIMLAIEETPGNHPIRLSVQ